MKPAKEYVQPASAASFHCFRRVDERFAFAWHYHVDHELTWIARGGGWRFVGDDASPFTAGDLVLLGANLPHTWDAPGPSEAVVVQFQPAAFGEGLWDRPEMRAAAALLHRAQRGLRFDATPYAARLDALPALPPDERFVAVLALLSDLARDPSARELASLGYRFTPRRGDDARLDRVCGYVSAHLAEPISQEAAAALAHLTPSAFSRFFRRATGRRFVDYVNERRIAEACRLLTETSDPVTSICFAVGFANLSNFNRRFRKLRGMTPRAYRAAHRR